MANVGQIIYNLEDYNWLSNPEVINNLADATIKGISKTCIDLYGKEAFETRILLVVLHHESTSLAKPASVELICIWSPTCASSIAFFNFIMGPGHCNPQASI